MLIYIKNILLNFIFPKYCEFCGEEGEYVCDQCRDKYFEIYDYQECHACRDKIENKLVHSKCMDKTILNGVYVCINYNKYAKHILKQLKYHHYFEFSKDIAKFMQDKLAVIAKDFDYIIPVPLHKRREWKRGFNQVDLMIKESEQISYPALKRIRNTKTQVGKDKESRISNLEEAFQVVRDVAGKRVLIVDDVMTTGTTIEVCAKILYKAGAKSVVGFVWARGELRSK